jgi:hypothetical protein
VGGWWLVQVRGWVVGGGRCVVDQSSAKVSTLLLLVFCWSRRSVTHMLLYFCVLILYLFSAAASARSRHCDCSPKGCDAKAIVGAVDTTASADDLAHGSRLSSHGKRSSSSSSSTASTSATSATPSTLVGAPTLAVAAVHAGHWLWPAGRGFSWGDLDSYLATPVVGADAATGQRTLSVHLPIVSSVPAASVWKASAAASASRATAAAPLTPTPPTTGRRSLLLLTSVDCNGTARPAGALPAVSRVAAQQPLDTLVNVYRLEWPSSSSSSSSTSSSPSSSFTPSSASSSSPSSSSSSSPSSAIHRATVIPPDATVSLADFLDDQYTNPTHSLRAMARALAAAALGGQLPEQSLGTLAAVSQYFDPHWYAAFSGFTSPENNNFATDFLRWPMLNVLGLLAAGNASREDHPSVPVGVGVGVGEGGQCGGCEWRAGRRAGRVRGRVREGAVRVGAVAGTLSSRGWRGATSIGS